MGRFWIEDKFIDEIAKHLSIAAQCVYHCLKRHVNRQRQAKIGSGKISEELGVSTTTTLRGLKELKEKQLISSRVGCHSFGYYEIYPLPQNLCRSPHQNITLTRTKNIWVPNKNLPIKELGINIKEEKRTPEEQEKINQAINKTREDLIRKNILSPISRETKEK